MFVDDPIQIYIHELSAVPPLTADEEAELSRHVLATDPQLEASGKRLLEGNLAIVVAVARRYACPRSDLLDLAVTGNQALFLALKTFAHDPGITFSSHAEACVEAAIAKATAESAAHD